MEEYRYIALHTITPRIISKYICTMLELYYISNNVIDMSYINLNKTAMDLLNPNGASELHAGRNFVTVARPAARYLSKSSPQPATGPRISRTFVCHHTKLCVLQRIRMRKTIGILIN